MASLSAPANPFPPPVHRRPDSKPPTAWTRRKPNSRPAAVSEQTNAPTVSDRVPSRIDESKLKEREERERKEGVNRKIGSQKAISIILRREATKAVIEKKGGPNNSKKLLPRTVLEALHERVTALRWESALKVFELLREQLWYRPNSGMYIKLIVMLGKCKQPEKAHSLFQAMIDEGCGVNHESYTALLSAYSRSGLFDKAFSLLEEMKNSPDCKPDVYTYSILIKSCVQVYAFDKVDSLLSDMASQGIKPSTITYNTLIDAYGKARKLQKVENDLIAITSVIPDSHHCFPFAATSATKISFQHCCSLLPLVAAEPFPSLKVFLLKNCASIKVKLPILADQKKLPILGLPASTEFVCGIPPFLSPTLMWFAKMESTLVEMLREGQCEPDVWTMNSTIRAFGGSGQIETMEKCYDKFQRAGIQADIKTFNVLLDSYGKTGNYEKMSSVMEYMQKYHFSWTLVTYNIVIDAFGRAGDLKQVEFLFRLMQSERIKPNCVTLCSLVRAYGQAGRAEKITGVLRFIEDTDVTLDVIFFNCLVDAYGMMGCFAEMKGVLEMMERKHCKPDRITYRTMINAYTTAGMTSHAQELKDFMNNSVQKTSHQRHNHWQDVYRLGSNPAV
ncbi:hypothetical protein RHSIM_Rhsim13G0046000 [Rhododendron simsii]|uniref:Pentatricopeptide repeat-containing protein n=1 Tax=Rhododendron simsii TaxID=118357 RepID=A0A834FZS2_RHOSS|nr:hypothetical protein RHSIM_Rhsim13G0046000 [Rhododendron simsii]